MKKFIIYVVSSLLVVVIAMTVMDIVYTKIYENSYPRTKFQYLRSFKDKKIDFIFIGSSRVENGIVPSIIFDKTNKKVVNFGFQAAKLNDIYTILQLIKNYNIHYEKIFIQVDYIYNIVDGHSNIFQYEMVPFIRENEITKAYSNRFSLNPIADYYIPFYRYCSNDLKIGFREVFANIINKNTKIIQQRGFGALQGNSIKLGGSLPDKIVNRNTVFDSIHSFCKNNNMNVVYYCAPFCLENKNKEFIVKLKSKIPELVDFSNAIIENKLFVNCNHLNEAGAKRFTEIFMDSLLLK